MRRTDSTRCLGPLQHGYFRLELISQSIIPASSLTMPTDGDHDSGEKEMGPKQVTIEDWDGDGAIRIPDEVLQELGVDVGDILYVIEQYVGSVRCLVLSKTPRIPDRTDELVDHWNRSGGE